MRLAHYAPLIQAASIISEDILDWEPADQRKAETMSNRNPIHQNATQGFEAFNARSPRNHIASSTLLAASTFLAISILPMSGAQASADPALLEVQGTSLSGTHLEERAANGSFTVLALVVEPEKDPPRNPPPRDGGDGEKPKRPERRTIVSVHG